MPPVWRHRVGCSRKSFFSPVLNLPQCPRDGALADLSIPELGHFALRFIPMLFDKGFKLLPIGDFRCRLDAPLMGYGLARTRSGFALQPQVNRVATDIKQLADLDLLESV